MSELSGPEQSGPLNVFTIMWHEQERERMSKEGKKNKRPKTAEPLPEMQGEQTEVGGSSGKPTLAESIQIVMDLAHENMIGEDPDPGMAAVAKRQEQALKRVQRFLDRAYPLRRRIKEMAKDAGI